MPLSHIRRQMILHRKDGDHIAWSKISPPGMRREDAELLAEVQALANLVTDDLGVS